MQRLFRVADESHKLIVGREASGPHSRREPCHVVQCRLEPGTYRPRLSSCNFLGSHANIVAALLGESNTPRPKWGYRKPASVALLSKLWAKAADAKNSPTTPRKKEMKIIVNCYVMH